VNKINKIIVANLLIVFSSVVITKTAAENLSMDDFAQFNYLKQSAQFFYIIFSLNAGSLVLRNTKQNSNYKFDTIFVLLFISIVFTIVFFVMRGVVEFNIFTSANDDLLVFIITYGLILREIAKNTAIALDLHSSMLLGAITSCLVTLVAVSFSDQLSSLVHLIFLTYFIYFFIISAKLLNIFKLSFIIQNTVLRVRKHLSDSFPMFLTGITHLGGLFIFKSFFMQNAKPEEILEFDTNWMVLILASSLFVGALFSQAVTIPSNKTEFLSTYIRRYIKLKFIFILLGILGCIFLDEILFSLLYAPEYKNYGSYLKYFAIIECIKFTCIPFSAFILKFGRRAEIYCESAILDVGVFGGATILILLDVYHITYFIMLYFLFNAIRLIILIGMYRRVIEG
jgi:hypothetical protein